MLTVGLAIFMTVVDQTIVNIALPTIGAGLQIDPSSAVWIVNAYQVAILLSLLPLSSAGDIIGYKRIYITGLALFGAASLGCAIAPDLSTLTFMRVVQGLGASGVMSVNVALVRLIHPASRLGWGIGINAVIIAVSAAAGPTITSAILAVASWPWLFAFKVPVAAAAVAIGIYVLPESPRASHRFDMVSAILSAITFGSLIAFLDALSRPGSNIVLMVTLALTLVSGVVLCRRQFSMPSPLLPVDLLRIPMFALSVGTSTSSFVAQTLAFIALPFQLEAMGYSAVETGLLMTPWPIATAFVASLAGKLSDRYPVGLLGLIGLAVCAAGLTTLALMDAGTGMADVAWRMALAGTGFGLYQSPNNRAIQASAPRNRSGGASGMQAMARLVGQSVGAAFTALVFVRFADGPTAAVWFAAGFSALAAAVSAFRLKDFPKPD